METLAKIASAVGYILVPGLVVLIIGAWCVIFPLLIVGAFAMLGLPDFFCFMFGVPIALFIEYRIYKLLKG